MASLGRSSGLSRLQRYVLRFWLRYALVVTSVLVAVLVLLYTSEVMSEIAGGQMPISMLGWQVLLHVPDALRTVAPLGVMVGVLLASGQLQQDGEWSQLSVLGLSPRKRLQALIRFGLTIAFSLLIITGLILPAAEQLKHDLLQEAAGSAEFWGVQAGRFTTLPDEDGVLYVAQMDRLGVAQNVFVSWKDEHGEQVLTSAAGNFRIAPEDGHRYVEMATGRRAVTDSEGKIQLLDFGAAEIRLPTANVAIRDENPAALSWQQLWNKADTAAVAEIHWRLAHPLCALILLFWAFALLRTHATHQGWAVLSLVLVYVVYSNLLNLGNVWLASGQLSTVIGLWWVHLIMLVPAVWFAWYRLQRT